MGKIWGGACVYDGDATAGGVADAEDERGGACGARTHTRVREPRPPNAPAQAAHTLSHHTSTPPAWAVPRAVELHQIVASPCRLRARANGDLAQAVGRHAEEEAAEPGGSSPRRGWSRCA